MSVQMMTMTGRVLNAQSRRRPINSPVTTYEMRSVFFEKLPVITSRGGTCFRSLGWDLLTSSSRSGSVGARLTKHPLYLVEDSSASPPLRRREKNGASHATQPRKLRLSLVPRTILSAPQGRKSADFGDRRPTKDRQEPSGSEQSIHQGCRVSHRC